MKAFLVFLLAFIVNFAYGADRNVISSGDITFQENGADLEAVFTAGSIAPAEINFSNTEADNDLLTVNTGGSNFTANSPDEVITAGNDLTWAGTTQLDVDDAFIQNDVDDAMAGDLTLDDDDSGTGVTIRMDAPGDAAGTPNVGLLITTDDDDDADYDPFEIRDDSGVNNDLLFFIDHTGAITTGTIPVGSVTGADAGTDLTADLEEETHVTEHQTGGGDAIDHGSIDGLGDDDHTIYAQIASAENISGTWEVQDNVKLNFGNTADWGIEFAEGDEDTFSIASTLTASTGTDNAMVTITADTGNSGMTADQEIFEVGKGAQDDGDVNFTELFAVDEDGDITVVGTTTFNTVTYTWPGADGTNGQVLTTSGAGVLTWEDPSGGGGGGDIEQVWQATTGDVSALTAVAGDTLDATNADSTIPWRVETSIPTLATEGEAIWDSTNDLLAIGDGTDPPMYLAQANSFGYALQGDSATAFFDQGTIELARGGTETTLSDPAADRIMFWDTTTMNWLTANTNISISGTNLNVDDAFVLNSTDDTMSGTLTLDGILIGDNETIGLGATPDFVVEWSDEAANDTSSLLIRSGLQGTTAQDFTDDVAMVTIAVDTPNTGIDADQEIFEVGEGGQDDDDAGFVELFSVDAEGDVNIAGSLLLGTVLAVAEGGTGAGSLNDLITLTTHTTGNYVATVAEGLAIDVAEADSEGATKTVAFDPTELLGSRTWGDASTDTIVWTWDRATGTDPAVTMGDGLFNLTAGAYQEGGNDVIVAGDTASGDLTGTYPGPTLGSGTVAAAELAATLTFSDGDFLDLSAINHAATEIEGIKLPQNTSLGNPSSGEGFLAYDTDNDDLFVYTSGSGWVSLTTGGAASDSFTTWAGDSGSAIADTSSDSISVVGGTNGIDTVAADGPESLTINMDYTEITTATFGAGSTWSWTFDTGVTDPVLDFNDGNITISSGDLILDDGTAASPVLTLSNSGVDTWTFEANNASNELTVSVDASGIAQFSIEAGTASECNLLVEDGMALGSAILPSNMFAWINGQNTGDVQLTVQGAPSQTADIFVVEASDGSDLMAISAAGAWSLVDGVRQTFNPDATNAGINVGAFGGDPSTPTDGDLWYDSTANELTARINGSNVAIGGGGSATKWDAIVNPDGDGDILMGESIQSLDWNTASTAAAFDGFTISITNDAATDVATQRLFLVENISNAATNTVENLVVIDNLDADTVTTALEILGTGAITTAIDVDDAEIVTALAIGSNTITTTSQTIEATDLDRLAPLDAALVDLDDSPSWTGTHDFTGGAITLENGATPTNPTAGQINIDTDAMGNRGAILFDDGTGDMYAVSVDAVPVTATHVPMYDGTNVSFEAIDLGTDTAGNYVAAIAVDADEIAQSGSGAETATVTLSLPATITLDDADLLDMSAILHNDTTVQGLKLPQGTGFSNPASGEGFLAYDTGTDQVSVYTTAGWQNLPTSASSPWQTTTGVVNLNVAGDTVTVGSSTAGGKFFIDGDANEIQLDIDAGSGQSVNVIQVEQFGGTEIMGFDNSGNLDVLGTITSGSGNNQITSPSGLLDLDISVDGSLDFDAVDHTITIAGDPALAVNQAFWSSTGIIFEGSVTAGEATVEGLLTWAPTTSDRTLTLPDATDTIVGRDTTDTLTNKTLVAASNVIEADTGDSATSFFSAGTIEHERGGLEADVSGYGNGLFGTTGAATVDVDTEAELETALGGLDVVAISTDDITSANLATALSDETGSGGGFVRATSPSLTTPTIATYLTQSGDSADAGFIRLNNAATIQWEASPTGTDVSALTVNSSEAIVIGASGASGVTITPAVTTTGDITINGGDLTIGSTTQDGTIVLHDDDAGGDSTVTITPVDATGTSYTLTLPPNDGDASQFLQTDGSGVLTWATPGGSGDITAVGPGYASGDAFTDGVASTGTTMLVWEGTTVDTNELVIISPSADPGADVNITLPSATGTLAVIGGNTYTGNHDFGGADFEMPQGNAPNADGEMEMDFTDGSLVVQHGSAHATLSSATDVVIGKLIHSFAATYAFPDLLDGEDAAGWPLKAIESTEFPHGVEITGIYLKTSESSTFSLNVERWDEPADGTPITINAGPNTSASTESFDSTITAGDLPAGVIIMIDLDSDDIAWAYVQCDYYEPTA